MFNRTQKIIQAMYLVVGPSTTHNISTNPQRNPPAHPTNQVPVSIHVPTLCCFACPSWTPHHIQTTCPFSLFPSTLLSLPQSLHCPTARLVCIFPCPLASIVQWNDGYEAGKHPAVGHSALLFRIIIAQAVQVSMPFLPFPLLLQGPCPGSILSGPNYYLTLP